MIIRIWTAAIMADDQAILVIAKQEVVLDETLQRDSIEQCALRGRIGFDINKLSSDSKNAFDAYLSLVTKAYRQGKGRTADLLSEQKVGTIFKTAVDLASNPISSDDINYFFGSVQSDKVRTCRVRLQLEKNLLEVPFNRDAFRYIYAHQFD
jgi:hypothetical protein